MLTYGHMKMVAMVGGIASRLLWGQQSPGKYTEKPYYYIRFHSTAVPEQIENMIIISLSSSSLSLSSSHSMYSSNQHLLVMVAGAGSTDVDYVQAKGCRLSRIEQNNSYSQPYLV